MTEKTPGENPQHVWDADRLSATDLRLKYPREWNSWRNSKQRAGKDWDPAFEKWADFLRLMGPAKPGETLDRTHNDNPRYGPGLCEWKSKKHQANNRLSTYNFDGEPLTARAEREGVNPRELRAEARGSHPFGANPLAFKPWPAGKETWWEPRYKSGPNQRLYRFEFLIRGLVNARGREEAWVGDHEDDLYSSDPAIQAEVARRGKLLHDVTRVLVQARIDFDRWLPAAEVFIRRHPNIGKDGQTRLSPDEDD